MFARLTLQFPFTYICICNRVRSVSFSDGVITWSWHNIQRWKRILYFVSLAAWLRFRHAKLTAGGKGRVRTLAIECVSFFLFFFSSSYRFSIFLRSNAHTHTNKEGAKTGGKAERRQRAVRFTLFLDYRLMSDSGLSFSLKYDLILPPSLINTYIFSGSFSCSVCFRLFRLVLSVTRDERRLNIGEYRFLQQQHHSRNDGSRRKKFVMNQAKRRTNWEAIVAEGEGEQSCLIFYMY